MSGPVSFCLNDQQVSSFVYLNGENLTCVSTSRFCTKRNQISLVRDVLSAGRVLMTLEGWLNMARRNNAWQPGLVIRADLFIIISTCRYGSRNTVASCKCPNLQYPTVTGIYKDTIERLHKERNNVPTPLSATVHVRKLRAPVALTTSKERGLCDVTGAPRVDPWLPNSEGQYSSALYENRACVTAIRDPITQI